MIKVMKSGLLTSVQDLGRYGFQKHGVIVSGAMDPLAHRIANLLVGNKENSPALEITMLGPVLEFQEDALISICGGDLSPVIDGREVGMWRAVFIKKGSELRFGQLRSGCRAYLAVAGAIQVPRVMESYSTYLRAEIGGFYGRSVEKDDEVSVGEPSQLAERMTGLLSDTDAASFREMNWTAPADLVSSFNDGKIRAMQGRQFHSFTSESQEKLFTDFFEVSTQSDRMGYRLTGPELALGEAEELLSEAVGFGTIQVPSDGNPIVLLADRQTTGGYPKIGQIATVDLPCIAQAKPGDKLRFEEISFEQAQQLFLDREKRIQNFKLGIEVRIR